MTEEIMLTPEMQKAQQIITECYQALQAKNSNVVREVLPVAGDVYQWDHYPKGDVIDKQNHSQYYYHSHPSKDTDRVPEHGHFHVFIRLSAIPENCQPLYFSEKYKADNTKDNLCHLFAIAMNSSGYPTALFTTNHWVTRGIWYSAEDCCQMLDLFSIAEDKEPVLTSRWVNSMATLFKDPLKQLIMHRDLILQEWQQANPGKNVFEARDLEVMSVCPLA